ncbi:BTAD domain-containing putative transcriptional regulator [Mangrovihabitans endophyticus]|uniref:XRE family transcriptional regulator n=1 Tax=Mangrovihabitans endophyticus TaxID=1751298 RepID=A0A8J3FQZ0_9ACTN|nr:BTAD domain-containing putative transcriptional regulator [Mangrovihabitans endophyticus]GGL04884.1 XRE family transcriptional regulator [Mangrovihabitans endophyticus]
MTGPADPREIRARRRDVGLSQRDLARLAGIPVGTLRDLEQGRTRHPRPGLLERLERALPADAATVAEPGLRLRILGPIAAHRDGRPLPLGPPQQRAVLGLLALRAGEVVHRAELVEGLWGPRAPGAADNLIQAYVGRLRHVLDPGRPPRAVDGRLVSTGRSYRLQLGVDELDWLAFQSLVSQAAGLAAAAPEPAAGRYERALALWRGAPAADLDEVGTGAAGAVLHRAWAAAVAEYARLAAGIGRCDRSLPALWRLVEREPLDERAHALLMRALAGSGDPAAAARVYADIRDRLDVQLGLQPGAELTETHQEVLRQGRPATPVRPAAGAASPVPRQLPLALPGFVGRGAALKMLDGLIDRLDEAAASGGTIIISAIGGAAGIGKTTLAVHWAHLVADRFPDGQLYADLHGFDPVTASSGPAEVIRDFLDALAVPAARIPDSPDAQAALFRSLLSGRQMLIVLDNARDSEQVRPLLPAGPGCVVVVTSRRQMIGLSAAEGAHLIMLDLFDAADARHLLASRLGAARVAAEQAAVTELIDLCAGLPLALSIAAGRIAARPDVPVTALLTQLRDTRRQLDVLSAGEGGGDLRSLFACTYRQLSPAAAGMFRLLGLHPGPELSLPAAASLAGLPVTEAWRALAELTATHLVTELTPDRYGLHDLLHAYAAELAREHDSPAERAAAWDRSADHYLHSLELADRLRWPAYRPIRAAAPPPGVTLAELVDPAQGLAWCQAERPALTILLIHAADTDPAGYPESRLADVWRYFHLWSHRHDLAAARRVARTAAGPLPDGVSQPGPVRGAGPPDRDRDEYRWLVEVSLRRGERLTRAYPLFGMSQLLNRVGRPRPALDYALLARDLCQAGGDRPGAALALNLIGREHLLLGRPDRAAESSRQALDLCRQLGDLAGEAFAADSLGLAAASLADHPSAVAYGVRAAELFARLGETDAEADALLHLGRAHRARGDSAAAVGCWHRALAALDDPQHPQATVLRELLAGTVRTPGPPASGTCGES